MMLPALLLATGLQAALTPAATAPSVRPAEETLRVLLAQVKHRHTEETRVALLGAGAELRDAVIAEKGAAKKQIMNRLPGMAADPFNMCRDLQRCAEAPLSLHVEDDSLINDAFLALARPWFNLQRARGQSVAVSVDPGEGVQLALTDLSEQPSVTLEASPAPTGGFDVTLREGAAAGKVYARERAKLLPVPGT